MKSLWLFGLLLLGVFNAAFGLLSHSQALARVSAVGIRVSSSCGCSDRYQTCCTSLESIRENTISGIITFKNANGCPVTITGGTETGHASGTYSHWTGYKVDISLNSCVDNYITSAFSYIGNRPGDGAPQYQSSAGNIYAKEGNHWDIVYY